MPLVQAKANLVSRISITMGIRIITKCGIYLLEFPETSSEYVQWVKIDSSIFGTDKNVQLGSIYIPAENTKYSCLNLFINII
jgi:hypothetical protein